MITINTSEIQKFLSSKALETFCSVTDSQILNITEAIRKGIEDNLSAGREWTGGNVKPLAPFTVREKGNSRPFVRTGLLLRSVGKKGSGKSGEVFINSSRSIIAGMLNNGQGNIPARPFFGISESVQKQIDQILEKQNNTI